MGQFLSLGFSFKGGSILWKNIEIPPSGTHFRGCIIFGPTLKNKKSGQSVLLAPSTAFQNGMSWPCSTNDHGGDGIEVKGLGPDQIPTSGGRVVVLPAISFSRPTTQCLKISSKLVCPFKSYGLFCKTKTHKSSVTLFHQNLDIFAHIKVK